MDDNTVTDAIQRPLDGVSDPLVRGVLKALLTRLPALLKATREAAVKRMSARLAEEVAARMQLQAELQTLRGEVRDLRSRVEKGRR